MIITGTASANHGQSAAATRRTGRPRTIRSTTAASAGVTIAVGLESIASARHASPAQYSQRLHGDRRSSAATGRTWLGGTWLGGTWVLSERRRGSSLSSTAALAIGSPGRWSTARTYSDS